MKCVPDNYILTSMPPQYRCKVCGNIWIVGHSIPVCSKKPTPPVNIITSSNIYFELVSDTEIKVMRNGKQIGRMYSDTGGQSGTPYPHEQNTYCLNSIQICGFDRMSEVWGCGPFAGKKDCVVHFMPLDEPYYVEARKRYEAYVKKFFEAKAHEDGHPLTKEKMIWASLDVNEKKDITALKSFDTWVMTEGL